jgi:RNA polymerase sigma factor (sigma-70 family)
MSWKGRSTDAPTMDRTGLERELERLHTESWGWALVCVGRDRAMAEDALQTAYLRVLSGQVAFGGRSSFKSWLFGVIRLTALEELRRARRWHPQGEATEATDPAPGADVASERNERAAALRSALAKVSPRQREVLQLVFYHEMTVEEAAAVMSVSVGSARTHYDRGKKALAELLAQVHVR